MYKAGKGAISSPVHSDPYPQLNIYTNTNENTNKHTNTMNKYKIGRKNFSLELIPTLSAT